MYSVLVRKTSTKAKMYRSIAVVIFILQSTLFCDAKPSGQLVEMPSNCEGKNYCSTKHELYPQKIIDDLLKNINLLEVERTDDNFKNDTYDAQNDCEVRVSIRPIYEIIDRDGNVRFVVQSTDRKFRQIIRIEECVNPGRIVDDTYHFHSILLQNANLFCVDTLFEYKFIVLSFDQKSLEEVSIRGGVPVSCNCRWGDTQDS